MGNRIKLSQELALGWAELKFMTDGQSQYHKDLIIAEMNTYGVIRKLNEFTAFKVIQGNGAAVSIQAGAAIDQYGNIIMQTTQLNNKFTLVDGAGVFTVILSWEESHLEEFKVNVEADGTVTTVVLAGPTHDLGDGGFKSRLRGIAQFPSLISFPESTLNTGEYLVQTVIHDGHLVLNVGDGVLQPESNVTWAVVGTFTPGVIVDTADKFPFKKGQARLQILPGNFGLSTSQDLSVVYPGYVFLATVSYDEATLVIVDRRSLNTYTKSTYI